MPQPNSVTDVDRTDQCSQNEQCNLRNERRHQSRFSRSPLSVTFVNDNSNRARRKQPFAHEHKRWPSRIFVGDFRQLKPVTNCGRLCRDFKERKTECKPTEQAKREAKSILCGFGSPRVFLTLTPDDGTNEFIDAHCRKNNDVIHGCAHSSKLDTTERNKFIHQSRVLNGAAHHVMACITMAPNANEEEALASTKRITIKKMGEW